MTHELVGGFDAPTAQWIAPAAELLVSRSAPVLMLGLLPDTLAVVPAARRRRVPAEVVHELQRLKGLYDGFGYRELARIRMALP